jgi:hypothetical protein
MKKSQEIIFKKPFGFFNNENSRQENQTANVTKTKYDFNESKTWKVSGDEKSNRKIKQKNQTIDPKNQ